MRLHPYLFASAALLLVNAACQTATQDPGSVVRAAVSSVSFQPKERPPQYVLASELTVHGTQKHDAPGVKWSTYAKGTVRPTHRLQAWHEGVITGGVGRTFDLYDMGGQGRYGAVRLRAKPDSGTVISIIEIDSTGGGSPVRRTIQPTLNNFYLIHSIYDTGGTLAHGTRPPARYEYEMKITSAPASGALLEAYHDAHPPSGPVVKQLEDGFPPPPGPGNET